ncbi:hypothetical protein [Deinococcus aquaedulcis]|uniref:hypothetical protein n=1 Tax=Deinococcus aquaedulcis TaxID=2840455 RepID=UPI001C83F22C|nr:hypothetical protein [Deinococcus aquaedulcis]
MTRKTTRSKAAALDARTDQLQTITITHALKELKLLDSRISARIGSLNAIRVRRHNEPLVAGLSKEQFETQARGAYQAIRALITRREAIKAAVVQSNATTLVTVGNKRMTVAAAVERKRSLEVRRGRHGLVDHAPTLDALVAVLSAQYTQAVNEEATLRAQITRDSEARVAAFLSKDQGKDKGGPSDSNTQEMERLYREANAPVMDDPLNLLSEMTAMREAAETFAAEVDRVLDETNATTTIRVPASV